MCCGVFLFFVYSTNQVRVRLADNIHHTMDNNQIATNTQHDSVSIPGALGDVLVPADIATPRYVYDVKLLKATLYELRQAASNPSFRLHYAVKANCEPQILKIIAEAGLGADTVSGGEIRMALDAGFQPALICFAGVGKTDAEIDYALSIGVGCFNVESIEELEVIAERAAKAHTTAPVALRINPDIDAHTHHYITTGLAENKFGIDRRLLDKALEMVETSEYLSLRGLHFHIGSQITNNTPFAILCERINKLQDEYNSRGIFFDTINVGGGLGIDYDNPAGNPIPDFADLFNIINSNLAVRPGQEIHFELGRSIVGQCGTLVTRVLYVKHGFEKKFVIADAGFTDLIRPALYQAEHRIENISADSKETEVYDIVGPICESTDTFATDLRLPVTHRCDLLAIRSAGAYGSSMAMQYNGRPLPGSYFAE